MVATPAGGRKGLRVTGGWAKVQAAAIAPARPALDAEGWRVHAIELAPQFPSGGVARLVGPEMDRLSREGTRRGDGHHEARSAGRGERQRVDAALETAEARDRGGAAAAHNPTPAGTRPATKYVLFERSER